MIAGAAADIARVTESPAPHQVAGLHVHPGWADAMPWLVQGTTSGADMSLFGASPVAEVMPRWMQLRDALGCSAIVHARQVHEAAVLHHDNVPAGVLVAPDADGHATSLAGVLLAVSTADCVPIFLAAPDSLHVAMLHAGWRGVAARIMERGVALLLDAGSSAGSLRMHLGPAICGACYEVGAEVPAGLGIDATLTSGRTHVDLRGVLAQRAIALGLDAAHISISSWCTRCGDSPFFSHRAGCRERQLGVLGLRADQQ